MKIVVIGGSGLIGSKVMKILSEHGHNAVAASPKSGVNTLPAFNGRQSGFVLRYTTPNSTRAKRVRSQVPIWSLLDIISLG